MIPFFFAFLDEIRNFSWMLLLSLGDMLKDLGCLAFEASMDLSISILNGMGSLFAGLNIAQYFSSLPTEVLYFANICSIGQCMTMIITSISIRLILQLIPFTRLGS